MIKDEMTSTVKNFGRKHTCKKELDCFEKRITTLCYQGMK